MRVQVISGAGPGQWSPPPAGGGIAAPRCWGAWRPVLRLGAESAGGLMLPDAAPSAATMYAPRGVWIDGSRTVVCDTGNHRVLIWCGWPRFAGAPADLVLGQADFCSEGPNRGVDDPVRGLHLPTGVLVDGDRLVVADAWNHRVLVWDGAGALASGAAPDHVIGQPDMSAVEPNRGAADPDAASFYWPFGVAVVNGRFYVCDTGNRRVLCWRDGLPLDGRPADVVLGQPDPGSREENRGGEPDGHSFRWPHAVCADGSGGVLVADAGNHRVLWWAAHPESDVGADAVVGQDDFSGASEFPYRSQEGRLRFPYAVAALDGGGVAVADTADNRVLVWPDARAAAHEPAGCALGQRDLASCGENRWESVTDDTLCWPYGVAAYGATIAVADSGNNRVVFWRASEEGE